MQLNYKVMGQGPPVVILHGVFGTLDNWQTAAKALAERHTVYLVDNRNHGRSPHEEAFNYEVMSEDLLNFIQAQRLDQPVVIGHSMGGKVAMYYACRYQPANLSKLIVVDIAPKYYRPHHQQILEGLLSIDLSQVGNRQQADQQLARYVPEPDTRQFLLKNLYRTDEGGFGWRMNLPVLNEKIENIGEGLPAHFRSDKPALFIRGGKSNYIRESDAALIKEHFPNATIETIAGAGHWVHAEQPALLLEKVLAFIDHPG
jgi:pimeloyl-ACP methyl ester carboxylesterase